MAGTLDVAGRVEVELGGCAGVEHEGKSPANKGINHLARKSLAPRGHQAPRFGPAP